jgi:hypothetical protein
MNFCKLTLEDGRSTYVNLDRVSEITRTENLTCMSNESELYIIVKETPEQIMNWISTGKLK